MRNLFEDAHRNIAWFHYFRIWGDKHQQLAALRHALGYGEPERYLPDDLITSALRARFGLEMSTKDYASALLTARPGGAGDR